MNSWAGVDGRVGVAGPARGRVVVQYVSIVLALLVYCAMWIGYSADWVWLDEFDTWALTRAYDASLVTASWVTFWDVLCTVLGPAAFRIAGAVVIVMFWVRRRRRAAVLVLLTVELSGVVTQCGKWLADRARPEDAMVSALGTSFPSGHALAVAAVAVTVVAFAAGLPTGTRVAVVVGMLGVVLAVGVGRVALNVHHPSDVLAGWALGYAYAMACVLALRPVTGADETPSAPGTSR